MTYFRFRNIIKIAITMTIMIKKTSQNFCVMFR